MKLGLLTAPFPETPLVEVADWARSVGFEALEIACWPKSSGPSRRYAGTAHIDVAALSDTEAREIASALAERDLRFRPSATIPIRCIPTPTIGRRCSPI